MSSRKAAQTAEAGATQQQSSGKGKPGPKRPRVFKITSLITVEEDGKARYVLRRAPSLEAAAESAFSIQLATDDDLVQAGADGVAIYDVKSPEKTAEA